MPNLNYMQMLNSLSPSPFYFNNAPFNFPRFNELPNTTPGINAFTNFNFNFNIMPQTQFGDRIPPYSFPTSETFIKMGNVPGFGRQQQPEVKRPT